MEHIKLTTCESTQITLKSLLEKNNSRENGPLLVSTLQQTKGIGRSNNNWDKYENSLAFSLLIKPNEVLTLSPLEIGVLLAEYFSKVENQEISLKWPNDLLINNKKCGGIICHLTADKELVVGVGINWNLEDEQLKKYPYQVTGIFKESKLESADQHLIPLDIYHFILANRKSPTNIMNLFNHYCAHLNKDVAIIDGPQIINGKFIGISEHGEAIIKQENKNIKILAGSLQIKD